MAEDLKNKEGVDSSENFDTTGLLLDYLSHWKWFLLSAVIFIGLGIFYIATVIPVYRVESSIYLSGDSESSPMSALTLDSSDPLVAMKNYIDETEIEILKSRNNVIKIVDSLNLCYTYYKKGTLRNKPLYLNNAIIASLDSASLPSLQAPIKLSVKMNDDGTYNIEAKTTYNKVKEEKEFKNVSLPYTVELSHGTITVSRNPMIAEMEGTEIAVIRSPRAMAKIVSSNLNIEFAKNSEKIIRVACTSDVVAKGVDIINALLDFYNRDIIEDKNRSAIQTEAFILDRLVMINDELRDVENRLQSYRQAHNITDLQAQSNLNLNLQSNYQTQLAEAEANMSVLNEIERLVTTAGTYELLPSAVEDPSITAAIEQYNNRVNILHRTLDGTTQNSPIVASIQEDLSRQKVRILQTIVSAKRNLESRIANINALENRSVGQLASTPTVDKGLQEIFREQQVKVNIYTFLLQRREEIALQKTLATNTARLIDDPIGETPVAPRKILILLASLIIGLGIPALWIFVRRYLFPRFGDQEELRRFTSVPIVGEICTADKGTHDDIVVGENVSTPIAELFRLLRNNISFARRPDDNNVILLTSAISGEGKTFVATNLALTYALAGKKVVVIGADIRRPVLAKRFGLDNQRGLTTFLSGQEHNIDRLIVQSNLNPNLYILPAGPIPPNPNELLMSPNMDELMSLLRKEFDYVIIDSAPIGVISDTYLILRHSDLQLFVTRANYSSRGSLKTLHDATALKKLNHVYVVLNGVDIKSSAYLYRRYGSYNNHKSYGYGYPHG